MRAVQVPSVWSQSLEERLPALIDGERRRVVLEADRRILSASITP